MSIPQETESVPGISLLTVRGLNYIWGEEEEPRLELCFYLTNGQEERFTVPWQLEVVLRALYEVCKASA